MMKLTREDLAMMLDEMNNNHADCIELDVHVYGYDYEFDYVDFDIYNGAKFIKNSIDIRTIICYNHYIKNRKENKLCHII